MQPYGSHYPAGTPYYAQPPPQGYGGYEGGYNHYPTVPGGGGHYNPSGMPPGSGGPPGTMVGGPPPDGSGEQPLRTSGGSHYPPPVYGWGQPYGGMPHHQQQPPQQQAYYPGAYGGGSGHYPAASPSPPPSAPGSQGLQSFEVLKYILQGMIPEAESHITSENIDAAVAKMEEMKGYKMRNMHLITSEEAVNYLRSLDDWLEQKRVAVEAIRMRRLNLGNQPPASSSSSPSPSPQSASYVNTNTSSPSSSAQYVHFQTSPIAGPASAPAATTHHQSTSSPSPPTSSQTTYGAATAVHSSNSAPSPLARSREVTGNVQYVSTAGDGPKSDGSVQYADPSAASSSAYVDTSGKGSAPAYAYAKVNGTGDSKPLTYVDYDAAKKKTDSAAADGDDLKQRNAKLLEAIQSKYNYREIDYDELRFIEKIGAGAFGAVYRGTWRGSVVAIKKLHDFDWFNMETVEEFRREAALAQLLSNHPMVVNFIGACSQAPNFCMVSEFCDQGSLESVLRGKHAVADIPLKTIVRIIRDAAAGIYHLHCEGVIHRDIAARNVMIGPDFSVFVGDFGFARLKEKGAAYAKTKSSLGPVKYMSPESIKEKKYSEKTDAYSFAVLMWEILTRKEPYEDEPLLQIALRVASQGLRLEVPPDTPQPLASLMKECWEQKPDDRPTFPAIIQRLHQFYDSLAE